MEYLGAGGQVVNSPNVNKGITALGININLNSYIENIKKKNIMNLPNIPHHFKRTLQT